MKYYEFNLWRFRIRSWCKSRFTILLILSKRLDLQWRFLDLGKFTESPRGVSKGLPTARFPGLPRFTGIHEHLPEKCKEFGLVYYWILLVYPLAIQIEAT